MLRLPGPFVTIFRLSCGRRRRRAPRHSSVAQWQSIRLLTGGLLVRVQPEEPKRLMLSFWLSISCPRSARAAAFGGCPRSDLIGGSTCEYLLSVVSTLACPLQLRDDPAWNPFSASMTRGKPISPNNVVRHWIVPACDTGPTHRYRLTDGGLGKGGTHLANAWYPARNSDSIVNV
jgi:hypothetical protein